MPGVPVRGDASMQLIRDGQVVWEGSVTDFLRSAPDYRKAMAAYEAAIRDATGASESTKRKWRRIVDEKPGILS